MKSSTLLQRFSRENRNLALFFILICIWIFCEYLIGNLFASILFLPFFLFLILHRRSYFLILGLPVLVIVALSTPVLKSAMELRSSLIELSQNPKQSLTNILGSGSGKDVLPLQTREILDLLRDHSISDFQLSKQFTQDPLIYQRTIEATWPVKMDGTSLFLFCSPSEIVTNTNCLVLDTRGVVVLEYCR